MFFKLRTSAQESYITEAVSAAAAKKAVKKFLSQGVTIIATTVCDIDTDDEIGYFV